MRKVSGVEWSYDYVTVDGNPQTLNAGHSLRLSTERESAALQCAIDAIKQRIEHCAKQLELHKKDATYNSWGAFWQDGHFSLHVYEAMQEFVANPPIQWNDINNKLVIQQIVRALFEMPENSIARQDAFNIASEIFLCL